LTSTSKYILHKYKHKSKITIMKKFFLVLVLLIPALWAFSQLGFNGYRNSALDARYQDLYQNSFNSIYFSTGILNLSIPIFQKKDEYGYPLSGISAYLGALIEWNNYRFDKDIRLSKDPSGLLVYHDNTFENKRSKLVICYLDIPLMFGYYSRNWFIIGGIDLGIRLGSHTKVVYYVNGKRTVNKDRENFWLSSLRPNMILGVGYKFIMLTGAYCPISLFEEDKGPQSFPYNVGINCFF